MTSATGPNTDVASIVYDTYGRPEYSTSVFGAQTTYTYSTGPNSASSPAWSQSTIDGRFTKTILDGLGRAIAVQSGTGSTVVSQVDTVYGSCGCSPTGKMIQTSLPHAPGATAIYKTYNYDGIGRTVSVVSPDGASTTRYFYAGNTVTSVDAAGKWKQYAMDAFGNVTQVTEPDPTTSITGLNTIAVDSGMVASNVAYYPSTGGAGAWYNASWSYRKTVTASHTMVSGASELTNFPLLVSVTDANLKSTSNGGYVAKSDGSDIVFTASDGQTMLNFEIETYNPSTGQLAAWVQVPALSPTSDTVVYLYYGNAGATSQQNANGVWDTNYKAVYHLPNGTTLSANDSTSTANNATINGPTATTGEIGGAASFPSTSANIHKSSPSGVAAINGVQTVSVWYNAPSNSIVGDLVDLVNPTYGSGAGNQLSLRNGTIGMYQWGGTNTLEATAPSAGAWHYLVWTFDGTTNSIYIDGAVAATSTTALQSGQPSDLYLSTYDGTHEYFTGTLDEVRLSASARSANWITTEYNNQSAPGTYLTVSAQQSSGGGGGGGTWYNSAWGYRTPVTVSHTMVSGSSSLSSFPVLVSVTDANLKTVANGGYVGKSDGSDILFTASDELTKLNHEIESYNPSTGQLIAWVQVSSLSPSSDSVIYAYYGNASASNQQNATGVWDSNYKGVYHFPNGTTLSVNDSTANANNGTNNGATATTGQIGGALSVNGSSQYVTLGTLDGLTTPTTLSAWIQTAQTTDYGAILAQGTDGIEWRINWGNSLSLLAEGYTTLCNSSGTIGTGAYHYVVLTYDGSTCQFFIDGASSGTTSASRSFTSANFDVGLATGPGEYFNGQIDEVRASSSIRSSSWIATEYNNQSAPSTYLSLGSQQAYSGGGGSGEGQVSTPSFSQNGPTVTISDATSGATIYYTTDGSTPTTSSNVYSGPIALSTSTYVTTYNYDSLNHLIKVTMPRSSGTQTRTFFYKGNDLIAATNPENGTVNYTYDANHRILTKTDAKNQQTSFTYDSYGRNTEIQRFYPSGNTLVEDTSQQVDFYYDSNPLASGYSQYVAGRLAAVQYGGGNCSSLGPPRTGCDTIQESYSYNVGGAMVGKQVVEVRNGGKFTISGSWTYDTEGRVTGVTYPSLNGGTPSFTYAYDTMGRLNTMKDGATGNMLVSGVTYGVANEIQAIAEQNRNGNQFTETRTYNSLFQLTQISVPTLGTTAALSIQYGYSANANNGKITAQTDVISGEQVVYTYDALNRLATAQTVTNPNVTQWGQSFAYDGFGNLTTVNVIKGSAPTLSVAYNASTNRQTGDTADANGNIGNGYVYDMANRLLQASGTTMQYAYAPDNKRVWRGDGNGTDELVLWSPMGQKLWASVTGIDVFFGSRLIAKGTFDSSCTYTDCVKLNSVAVDRLGSIGKFYPYGVERPSATQNDTEKFTGYFRDAATGLDYAKNRYEQPGMGRFMTPDPYQASGGASDPGSWNRYAYVRGDPVNRVDRKGLLDRWGDDDDDDDDDFFGGGPISMSVQLEESGLGPAWTAENTAANILGCPTITAGAFLDGAVACGPPSGNGFVAPPPPCYDDMGKIYQTFEEIDASIINRVSTQLNGAEITSLQSTIQSDIVSEMEQILAWNAGNSGPDPAYWRRLGPS